jgi:hypothetical protein
MFYIHVNICPRVTPKNGSGFGGLVVSMLASGTQDRGFEAVGFFG